jgi:hypothetical protein
MNPETLGLVRWAMVVVAIVAVSKPIVRESRMAFAVERNVSSIHG